MRVARTGGGLGLLAVVVFLGACGGGLQAGRATEASARTAVPDPPAFAYVTSASRGTTVELRSAATGRLVKRLATFGDEFTGNGLAVSPDRAHVYVTLIGHRSLRIERIAVADRRRTFVALGEQPAVSPDGRRLAYIASERARSQTLAVRDLASGRTRTIDLARLEGGSAELFNGTVAWLGDGADVVALPGPIAYAAARPSGAGGGPCARATCLIVVHVAGRRLTARRVVLPRRPDGSMTFAGEAAHPHSLLLADGLTPRMTVDRVALSGSRAHAVRVLSVKANMPVAFSPSGARLLYLVGSDPLALWVAEVERGRLAHPHRLMRDARLGEAAW